MSDMGSIIAPHAFSYSTTLSNGMRTMAMGSACSAASQTDARITRHTNHFIRPLVFILEALAVTIILHKLNGNICSCLRKANLASHIQMAFLNLAKQMRSPSRKTLPSIAPLGMHICSCRCLDEEVLMRPGTARTPVILPTPMKEPRQWHCRTVLARYLR